MNKIGKIVKSQKELYFVRCEDKEYISKARGLFRDKNLKPLVGDNVVIQVLDNENAYISEILDRKNILVRPPITNIDQIVLVSSLVNPELNYIIFDKYLVMLEHFNIPVIIVINKSDLAKSEDISKFTEIYSKTDYKFIFTSVKNNIGIDELKILLKDKISAFAGPSGVGKSSLLNKIFDSSHIEIGDISRKTKRGKHTTRHVELFEFMENSFIFDTPGFSALNLDFIDDFRDLRFYFTEFNKYSNECKFKDCIHINEPQCAIKKVILENKISTSRYDSYKYIIEEIKKGRKY